MDVLIIIILSISINPQLVYGRYCTFLEVDGESKYYICPRNEYCCNFGCCLTPTFQFYQLWYYWLMVLFMFLLCSGGTWWYRYWLQGGYSRDLGSTMPVSHRIHQPRSRQTQVSYRPGRETVVMHHVWKPNRNGFSYVHNPPPSYSIAQCTESVLENPAVPSYSRSGASSSSSPQPTNLKPSPYYQLYGPPPSYESVISETLLEQRLAGSTGVDNISGQRTGESTSQGNISEERRTGRSDISENPLQQPKTEGYVIHEIPTEQRSGTIALHHSNEIPNLHGLPVTTLNNTNLV
uniref:WW domain binding protein VOPP1 n=1 Tax=Clastoptera arizonana TaxID=38151 RepID=A0A1B6DQ78_9HEMI